MPTVSAVTRQRPSLVVGEIDSLVTATTVLRSIITRMTLPNAAHSHSSRLILYSSTLQPPFRPEVDFNKRIREKKGKKAE
mgnify:CR=1 FL=1